MRKRRLLPQKLIITHSAACRPSPCWWGSQYRQTVTNTGVWGQQLRWDHACASTPHRTLGSRAPGRCDLLFKLVASCVRRITAQTPASTAGEVRHNPPRAPNLTALPPYISFTTRSACVGFCRLPPPRKRPAALTGVQWLM